jgi:hypothetical protein
MTLARLLQENKDAIVRRWLDDVLAMYPGAYAAVLRREQDPFANPVGQSLRLGLAGIFVAVVDGADFGMAQPYLAGIIKIRAVQELTASQAVDFVFRLKEAVRAELGAAAAEGPLAAELVQFERRVDRIALAAFDVFVQCREQVCELRINEVKRKVSWVVEKLNSRGPAPERTPVQSGGAVRQGPNGQCGEQPCRS